MAVNITGGTNQTIDVMSTVLNATSFISNDILITSQTTKILNSITTLTSSSSTFLSTNITTTNDTFSNTTFKTTKYMPTFSVNTDYCRINHHSSLCGYVAVCIFIGYLLRLLVLPFVKFRIDKLKHQVRGDYNFSLLWLWLIATIPFIDIIEFFASSNFEVYTRTITMLNVVVLVFTLYTISVYIHYYGHTKENYRNYVISITFIMLWIILVSLRSIMFKHDKRELLQGKKISHEGNLFSIYIPIYIAFATVQVFKNTTNKTGRCLTHASFSFWLLSSFFLSAYEIVISSHRYDYIMYRTFFEISTLLVILLQNIYYQDSRHQRQLINTMSIDDQEMISNPEMSSSNKPKNKKVPKLFDPFSKEISNSGYLYFKDEDNIIDESKLNPKKLSVIKTNADDDEIYFDKNQTANKLSNTASPKSVKVSSIEYNDSLQSEEVTEVECDASNSRSYNLRKKIGIFFSYTDSRLWVMLLSAFCVIYYLFAYIMLIKSVQRSFYVYAAPLVHPIAIFIAIASRRFCLAIK
jgi:hypothetical protein